MLQDSVSAIKHKADTAERVAISLQQAAERAIKNATNAKSTAGNLRKTVDDREEARRELEREI